MRRLLYLVTVALLVSLAIVTIGLFSRQTPERSATDAYIAMRSLFPDEAAALLLAEDIREASAYSRTVVVQVDSQFIVLLTRDYPIRVASPTTDTPENHGLVTLAGRSFRLESNSWENCVSRYRVARAPTEQFVGRAITQPPDSELRRSRFNEDRVSFSSDWIWLYFVTEVVLLTLLFTCVVVVLFKMNWLLWLPCLMTLQVLMMLFVRLYSPAFYDADWFHQRIVVEGLALVLLSLIGIAGPFGLYLVALSLVVYLVRKLGLK